MIIRPVARAALLLFASAEAQSYDPTVYTKATATSSRFKALRWRNVGPFRGGRAAVWLSNDDGIAAAEVPFRFQWTFPVLYSLAESPKTKGLLWAGSDDGLIHVRRGPAGSWKM